MVLDLASVSQSLQLFLRGIHADSITKVEHAGGARGQFAMMRVVRQCCLATGSLFTMAFDPVYRCLTDNAMNLAPLMVSSPLHIVPSSVQGACEKLGVRCVRVECCGSLT